MTESNSQSLFRITGQATAEVDLGPSERPITVIANESIRATLEPACVQQAVNARLSPGVSHVVLNPDAHVGYGAPVGCVMISPTHIYPGPVGVDIKCSMSLLQTELPASAIEDPKTRRQLIREISRRVPTGAGRGSRHVEKGRSMNDRLGFEVVTEGASRHVLKQLGIPTAWAERCEDAYHRASDGSIDSLSARLEMSLNRERIRRFQEKMSQLGSYGGGNHFGECEVVHLSQDPAMREIAEVFGLKDQCVGFLSHCGSRGFGYGLASQQFAALQSHFQKSRIGFPFGDTHLVYAEHGSPEATAYLNDMAMGANFATVNHLLINAMVLESIQAVFPGIRGSLVYFISHNIARREPIDGQLHWVHRKGATRAFPAGHEQLARTPFAATGHPILLPGNPRDGSSVMVALPGARASCYSVNHGAGRCMSRTAAKKKLSQQQVDQSLAQHDVLSNCRTYPRDEAPAAYKDFEQVLASVKGAGLAAEVARLQARFVMKDGAPPDD
jgi:tRNA-splicing ligase RtcB